jgi:hypothetical protein
LFARALKTFSVDNSNVTYMLNYLQCRGTATESRAQQNADEKHAPEANVNEKRQQPVSVRQQTLSAKKRLPAWPRNTF